MPKISKKTSREVDKKEKALVEMKVVGIKPENKDGRPQLWLKCKYRKVFLCFGIGPFEANAICMH